MGASYPTKLLLAFRSGDMCAFPECERLLPVDSSMISNPVVIGEAAHIAGEKPGTARHDKTMTPGQRDHYDNLIYLCGNHHTQIDGQESDFSVDCLIQMKAEHERRVREAIHNEFVKVGFPELEQVTDWIIQIQPSQSSFDFTLIYPEDKINRNHLSEKVRVTITMGLSIAHEVRAFVESETKNEPDFPERLKSGFLTEYHRLRHEGIKGDELFDLMCHFAQHGFREQAKRSAGIAVLIYLFEACEVFEK